MKKATFVFIAILLVFAVLSAIDEYKPNIQRIGMEKQVMNTPRHTDSRDVDIYVEDFSRGAPAGWQIIDNNGGTNYWVFDNPDSRTINTTTNANGFAIIDSDYLGYVDLDTDMITDAIDCSHYPSDPIILEFEHYFYQYQTSVATVYISTDGSSWTQLQQWTTSSANAETVSYDITAYAAVNGNVYVRWSYQGNYEWYWAVDDVRVYAQQTTTPPNCSTVIQPADADTGIDINTALMWEAADGVPSSYYLYFGTDNPPTNIENGTDVYPQTSYLPATLDFGQTYYWQVVPSNEYGDAAGCPVWSFTTYTPLSLPYTQGFESGAPYWYINNDNGDNQSWTLYTGLPNTGSYSVGINTNTTSTADDWGILPALDLIIGYPYQISYYELAADGDQDYSVWWGTSQDPADMSNFLYSTTLTANPSYTYTRKGFEFVPYGTGPFFIGFHFTSAGTDGTNTYLMMDDLAVQEVTAAPDCPVMTAPITGVTGQDVQPILEWDEAGNLPLGYYLHLGTDNPPTNVMNGVDIGLVNNWQVTQTLDYSTTYYWYVVGYNGFGNSAGCVPESFETKADPTVSLFPYSESFEADFGSWANAAGDDGDWLRDSGSTPSGSTGPTAAYDGSYFFYLEATDYSPGEVMYLDGLFDVTGLTNPVLTFFYHMYGAGMGTLSVDIYDGSWHTGVWSLSGQQQSSSADPWLEASVDLSGYNRSTLLTVRFVGERGSDYTSDMCVDLVGVFDNATSPDPASNPSPADTDTDVSALTNLSWSGSSGASGYKLSMWYDDATRANQYICQDKDLGNVLMYDPSDDGVDALIYDETYSWTVVPYNANGDATGCPVWSFVVESDPSVSGLPWSEDFENGGAIPTGWSQENTNGTVSWDYYNGGQSSYPSSAYSGNYNARFYQGNYNAYSTMLITPTIDLSAYNAVRLTFMHAMNDWSGDQDELKVYYKNTAGGAWNEIAYYNTDTPNWTKRIVDLPNLTSTYWIAFEGISGYGYGVCIDEVMVLESLPIDNNIYITEVSDNATGQDASTGYIEIYNQKVYSVDVSGYQIRVGTGDGAGNFTPTGTVYTIPDGTTISGYDFLLIGGGADYAAFTAAWGITDPINYLSGDTQLGLTSGVAYDLYNPFTRAGSMDDTPNVGAGEHVVQIEGDNWSTGPSDDGTPDGLDGGQTLPVTFATFTAQSTANENVLLMWTTQSESDMQGYHIYRSESSEANDAVRLTTDIIAASNTSAESNYEYRDEDVELEVTYYYWIESYENSGFASFHGPVSTIVHQGQENPPAVVEVTTLKGNSPNPFNPETKIEFSIKGTDNEMVNASLVIYNIKGQRVKTFFNQHQATDKGSVVWHGNDDSGKPVASGVYFYRLKTSDYSEIRKMMLLK